jgi:hypothetical protein
MSKRVFRIGDSVPDAAAAQIAEEEYWAADERR